MALLFSAVELDRAWELDAAVFEGYLDELREAGWGGDRRMVRCAYAATSALRYGIGIQRTLDILLDESRHATVERTTGRPIEGIADHFAGYFRSLFTLAEEARTLLPTLRWSQTRR